MLPDHSCPMKFSKLGNKGRKSEVEGMTRIILYLTRISTSNFTVTMKCKQTNWDTYKIGLAKNI